MRALKREFKGKADAALNGLKATDFVEMKAYKSPPPAVVFVMEALLVVLAPDQPDRGWNVAKKVLGPRLLGTLKAFRPETVTPAQIETLMPYVTHAHFADVGKSSVAARGVAQYLTALVTFGQDLAAARAE